MSKKIVTTVTFALLMIPWAAQAQSFDGWGYHHRVSAPEMPSYGMLAAALCGFAGYLVLRRRYAQAK
jgi:hypothetical protein